MREVVTTILDLVGLALLVAAAYVIWWPAALIVAGLALLAISRAKSLPPKDDADGTDDA